MGPYEVLIDGESVFTSREFGWWSTSDQLDVSIPPGSKTITLKLPVGTAYGAWAQAGFLTTPKPEVAP